MTRATQSRADELGLKRETLAALYNHLDMLKASGVGVYPIEGSLMREFKLGWTAARRVLAAWKQDWKGRR